MVKLIRHSYFNKYECLIFYIKVPYPNHELTQNKKPIYIRAFLLQKRYPFRDYGTLGCLFINKL
jgi:hypothetical protein